MKSVLSVCFHSLTFDFEVCFFACVQVVTIARRGLKLKVKGQGHCEVQMQCVCYTTIYCKITERLSLIGLLRHCSKKIHMGM